MGDGESCGALYEALPWYMLANIVVALCATAACVSMGSKGRR